MIELTEREKAMKAAADSCNANASNISIKAWAACYDVCRAFDAAQEPKAAPGYVSKDDSRMLHDALLDSSKPVHDGEMATAQPEPPVVETVREALGRLLAMQDPVPMAERRDDAWAPSNSSDEADVNAATILNNVPALLELAKRGGAPGIVALSDEYQRGEVKGLEDGFRNGVIKGLERAARHIDATANLSAPHERIIKFRAQWCREEADRIRSGGAIEPSVNPTSTGGTPGRGDALGISPPRNAEPQGHGSPVACSRSAAPEQPNPAAGGAPQELPKGWIAKAGLDYLWGCRTAEMPVERRVAALRMARAALKLRHAASIALAELSGPPSLDRFHNARNVLRLALDAAEKPND